ncbi:MAG TPA: polymer-forming cytoskeletal protein [Vicinamibacteria bacterium]|nr:polymer-forming cytoskeletal protein [Vicinamibacteria bacterium]
MVQKDEPQTTRRFTDTPFATVIGPGLSIRGELSGEDAVDLGGTLEGPSNLAAHYRVRAGARVSGAIEARSVALEGSVQSPKIVADKVEIGASAQVVARIEARVVAIAEGARFDGELHMEGNDPEGGATFFKERRRETP